MDHFNCPVVSSLLLEQGTGDMIMAFGNNRILIPVLKVKFELQLEDLIGILSHHESSYGSRN
jgi:hypothetical protein